jgi:hypothetical protein
MGSRIFFQRLRGTWRSQYLRPERPVHPPFAKTKADRQASSDPRLSIEERYPSFDKYYSQVKRAVENMVRDRLLLCEDADDQLERLVQAGIAAGVPEPTSGLPDSELRHCKPPEFKGGKKR